MALSKTEAHELAELLPADLRCDDARQRLLCVVALLRELTDADHVLSNADLRAILAARFGEERAPAENTLAADLHAIAQSGALDLRLHVTPSGYWCERSRLTPVKARLMLNAVPGRPLWPGQSLPRGRPCRSGACGPARAKELPGGVLGA